MIIVSVTFHRK